MQPILKIGTENKLAVSDRGEQPYNDKFIGRYLFLVFSQVKRNNIPQKICSGSMGRHFSF